MTTTEKLLLKWQVLNPDEQAQVLAFIDELAEEKKSKLSPSKLGEKLRKIRQEIINSGLPLLTEAEADQEKAERRGGYGEELT